MLWKFALYGNWYDSYYIGLDGIEMYDSKGVLLDVIACGATISGTLMWWDHPLNTLKRIIDAVC